MELILSDSFEDMRFELEGKMEKMMEFVVPVKETEQQIALIAQGIRNSGKLVLMHGIPGVGKSTFVQSLKWRAHLPIRDVINIDATTLKAGIPRLAQLVERIKVCIEENDVKQNVNGITTLVIDYLESLKDESPESKKSFFRDLNGILRKTPILIIWPITEENDVNDIISFSKAVSGTLFVRNNEVIKFAGPKKTDFPSILKNTIAVLNTGYIYSDFQLTDGDFDEILEKRLDRGFDFPLREYISDVRELWYKKTNKLQEIIKTIPKPTEIWFIFSMPEAEQAIAQFVRKSINVEDCWDAYHAKLDEYIHGNQKAEYWDSKRLQLALSGAFKTKIMYLPTNALVSCLAAYGKEYGLDKKIDWNKAQIKSEWSKPSTAKRFLKSTPIVKQLQGETTTMGAKKGRINQSVEAARKAFEEINKLSSNSNLQGDGSDKPINKALVKALSDVLPNFDIKGEKQHLWLKNIYPDIQIELEDKLVCLEFHYTKKTLPSTVADYVLRKLDTYMRQIENKYPNLFNEE